MALSPLSSWKPELDKHVAVIVRKLNARQARVNTTQGNSPTKEGQEAVSKELRRCAQAIARVQEAAAALTFKRRDGIAFNNEDKVIYDNIMKDNEAYFLA